MVSMRGTTCGDYFLALYSLNLALFLSVDHVATYMKGRQQFGESGGATFVESKIKSYVSKEGKGLETRTNC